MYECPVCSMDLNRVIADVLRKVDVSRFQCPMCQSDLKATVVRTVKIEKERT